MLLTAPPGRRCPPKAPARPTHQRLDRAPILVHIDDIDRFTRSGEAVMLAIRVIQRGEVEHSYGSIPDLILSSLKAEPLFGDYVGAYTCPDGDCNRIFDAPPA